MKFAVKPITGALAAALLTTAIATPADAQNRRHRQNRGGGISLGDIVLGTIAVAGVATVAGALGSGRRSDRRYDDGRYGRGNDDGRYEGRLDNSRRDGGRDNNGRYDGSRYGDNRQASVEACAYEAEQEVGQRFGGYSQVREIDNVEPSRDGYRIRGTVEVQPTRPGGNYGYVREGYERVQFSCAARGNRVVDLKVGSYYAQR